MLVMVRLRQLLNSSKEVRVNEGDTLTGVIILAGQNEKGLDCDWEFADVPGTKLSVQGIAELSYCCEVLEAYGTIGPADYPQTTGTAFSGIRIRAGADVAAPQRIRKTGEGPQLLDSGVGRISA